VSTRSPARLIVALAVAAVLACFLIYQAVAGSSTPTVTPSQVGHQTGRLAIVGTVIGPVEGDAHSAAGMRFALKDPNDGKAARVLVDYHGDNPPPLFQPGRSVVVTGRYANGRLAGTDIVTKCPSKYTTSAPKA
jgi:cytochrome c-type biogenesis protein CcmE